MTEEEFTKALVKAHAEVAQAKARLEHLKATRRRACIHCGKEFFPKRVDARFCTPGCRYRAQRTKSLKRQEDLMRQLADSFHGS